MPTRRKQRVNNRALRDVATRAFADHFRERYLHFLQVIDFVLHGHELPRGHVANFGAGILMLVNQRQQFADLRLAEAKLAAATHKGQALQMRCRVNPVSGTVAGRMRHDTDLLVVADRLDIDLGEP